jgi:hypothetical protein
MNTRKGGWKEIEELNAEWREIDERLAGAEQAMNRWESITWFTIGALSGFAGAWAYAVEVLAS